MDMWYNSIVEKWDTGKISQKKDPTNYGVFLFLRFNFISQKGGER